MFFSNYLKLKDKERIISVVRRYGFTYFWWALLIFVLFLIPSFFMFWLFAHSWWGRSLYFIPVALGLYLLIKQMYLWKQNIFIITSHRLVDIEKKGFFHHLVSEVSLEKIDDVSGKVKGFFGTVLKYGDVEVQVANSKVQIIAHKVKDPLLLQQQINELRENYLSRYSQDFSADTADRLIDKLYELELPDLMRVNEVLQKRIVKMKK